MTTRVGRRGDEVETDRALASIKQRLFGDVQAEPSHIGRFVVVRRIGTGGMGVVYECADPELDRRVALKLVRPSHGLEGEAHRARLVREAKALAAIAHPNVIAVFDVGMFRERVFIAMEYVEGPTLRQWLETPRTRPETIHVFVQIGRGLAAAHAVGLIHRDLKPDNVIVGIDAEGHTRVRVLDFGLARRPEDEDLITDGSDCPPSSPGGVTESGWVMGTPAYMAPEQYVGRTIDGRTDQFAYCVALCEALVGTRPRRDGAHSRARIELPRGLDALPQWLRRVVVRGLSQEPSDRYASMPDLLHELERRRSRRGPAIAAGVAIATLGVGVAAWIARSDAQPICAGAEHSLEATWNDDTRAAGAGAFANVGAPDEVWTLARSRLDAYAQEWTEQARESCEATHERHEQSLEIYELRRDCLDQRRRELVAIADLFSGADPEIVREAGKVTASLPPVSECADVDALAKRTLQVPDDPQMRTQVEAVRAELARASGLASAGKYQAALDVAEAAMGRADALGYRAVQAEAQLEACAVLDKLGRTADAIARCEGAVWAGQASGHDRVTADAAARLIYLVGYRQAKPAEGRRWSEMAESTISREGGDRILEARRLNSFSAVLQAEGKYGEAIELLEQALQIATRVLGPAHAHTITTLANLGTLQRLNGDYAGARASLEDAVQRAEGTLGPQHPDIAMMLLNLAAVHQAREDLGEAAAIAGRARAIYDATVGLESMAGVALLGNMAALEADRGNLDAALALSREGLSVAERVHGPDHPATAKMLSAIGNALRKRGQHAEALAVYEDALRRKQRVVGEMHPEVVPPLRGIALCHLGMKRFDEAREALTTARNVVAKSLPPEHPDLAMLDLQLAQLEHEVGNHERALELAEAGVASLEPREGFELNLARIRFTMAQSLRALGRDPERARSLALAAREALAADNASTVADIDAFLDDRRRAGL